MKEKMVEEVAMILYDIKNISSNEAIKKYEKRVLELNNPYLSYVFARDVEGANIKEHCINVIKSKDPLYNYEFAKAFQKRKIDENNKKYICILGEIVILSGDALYNYRFARDVKGADILRHANVVISSGNAELNFKFAKNIKGADINAHAEVVINSKNPKFMYLFARNIKNADKEKFKNASDGLKDNKGYKIVINELGGVMKVKKK